MSHSSRLLRSLVVATAITCVHGCGSPVENSGGRATPELPVSKKDLTPSAVQLADDVVSPVSSDEKPDPVSALEIANAPIKVFSRDEESGALNVSFADLNLKRLLNIESVTEDDVKRFPAWLKSLHGKKIRIRGYMYPTFEETGIDTFLLDYSHRITNFGADPKVYELVEVHLSVGTTTNYVRPSRSIEVIGTFRIDLRIEDGSPGLYFLDDAVVIGDKPVARDQ